MPQSLVLHLVTNSPIEKQYLQGHALQQLFFDLVYEVDPGLGNVLRQDKENCAYSLSTLQSSTLPLHHPKCPPLTQHLTNQSELGNLRLLTAKNEAALQFFHHQAIAPDVRCWWRITFLDDELFDHLSFLWSELLGECFQLGAGKITIQNVVANQPNTPVSIADWPGTDWISGCSYQDIYQNASAHEKDIHLQFVTPTAFETREHHPSMPTANTVFQSLRKYWNRYSGLAFLPYLIKNVVPIQFNIKTENTKPTPAPNFIYSFTGQVSFRILDSDPLTTKRINTLADFSDYCGIGYGKTVGMGTVRRLKKASTMPYQPEIQT